MTLDARATRWMDPFWDEAAGLLRYPSRTGSPTNPYQRPGVHVVRESASYALALLRRGGPGDAARADRALGSVLAHQIEAPGEPTHGTWRRSPLEPVPGPAPREWIDYDPNWREFIGTALALVLEHALPAATVRAIEGALRTATEGSVARDVDPAYTNIALMAAFLLDWCGDRLGEASWRRRGEALAAAVADAYRTTGAFPEHNSPTYYGVDLYGLALWRARAPSARLRALGAELEAALWRDLARFHHAGLANLCGPYTRAYGMDMTRYVATLGAWIALAEPGAPRPLPDFADDVAHAHDFCEIPLIAALGSQPPPDVTGDLRRFPGAHGVEQVIVAGPHRRVATARLEADAMWGGEHTSARSIHWQHHPATLHWRRPGGRVGWVRLVTPAPVDAVADASGLDVTVHTGVRWLREGPFAVWLECDPAPAIEAHHLALDGLRLRLDRDPALAPAADPAAEGGPARVGFTFEPGAAPATLHLRLTPERP